MTIAEIEFDLGNKCVIQKKFEDAISHYEISAQNNYADAQYNLGFCYSHGIGVKQNYLNAIIWYNKAIANGLSQAEYLLLNELEIHVVVAQRYLGCCYECGDDGVTQDYEQAVYWYTRAVKQGDVVAQYSLQELPKRIAEEQNQNIIHHNLLIESNTAYSGYISRLQNISFTIIREYARERGRHFGNDDSVWQSLNRGRAVLATEEQMYKYLFSYGRMHKAKLNEAFDCINKNVFANSEIEIIDYACGQGLASICFKDYFQNVNVAKIVLIEPSTMCLRRAALHVLKSYRINENNISTINKYLDDLILQDIYTEQQNIKVHLFSNILDMAGDNFDLNRLTNLIRNRFSGVNYFICVSPYIDNSVPEKFDKFLNSFDNVSELGRIDLRSGEWINHWAIVLRVFKVQL